MKLYQISSLYKINYPLERINFKNHQNVFEILPITKYINKCHFGEKTSWPSSIYYVL